jgi:hypothetical protein
MNDKWDILLLNSQRDHYIASKLEDVFMSCGLSVWKFESDTKSSKLGKDAHLRLKHAKSVVLILSKNSRVDRMLTALALEAAKKHKLLPVKIDKSRTPEEFCKLQVLRVRSLELQGSFTDEGLYHLLKALKKMTGKEFRVDVPLHERNKQMSAIYIKKDGVAYQYYGSATSQWLASEAYRQQKAAWDAKQRKDSAKRSRSNRRAASTTSQRPPARQSSSGTKKRRVRNDSSKPQVFISYSRKDHAVADRLDFIFQVMKLEVWWDEHIPLGDTWEERIKEKLSSVSCVLVIWSKRSVASSWVLQEAQEGLRSGTLLGLKIDNCIIPEPYSSAETFDFINMKESITINDPSTRDFLRRIEQIIGSDFMSSFEADEHTHPGI